MATKDKLLFSKDKHQSFTNNVTQTDKSNQYLNLNQNQNCQILIPVQYSNNLKNDKYYVSDEYDVKGKSEAWDKSADLCLHTLTLNDKTEAKKKWKKNSLSNVNCSTLSLHISAYENTKEFAGLDTFNGQNVELKKNKINMDKQLFPSLMIQNPFEFSRQQVEGHVVEPGIARFKANQKLLGSHSIFQIPTALGGSPVANTNLGYPVRPNFVSPEMQQQQEQFYGLPPDFDPSHISQQQMYNRVCGIYQYTNSNIPMSDETLFEALAAYDSYGMDANLFPQPQMHPMQFDALSYGAPYPPDDQQQQPPHHANHHQNDMKQNYGQSTTTSPNASTLNPANQQDANITSAGTIENGVDISFPDDETDQIYDYNDNNRISLLLEENEMLKRQNEELKRNALDAKTDAARASREFAVVHRELVQEKKLNEGLKAQNQLSRNADREIQVQHQQINAVQRELDEQKKRYEVLQSENRLLRNVHQEAEEIQNQKLSDLQRELRKEHEFLEASQAENERLNNAEREAKKRFDETLQEQKQSFKAVKLELAQERKRCEALQAENELLNVVKQRKRCEALQAENELLNIVKRELAEEKKLCKDLQAENERLLHAGWEAEQKFNEALQERQYCLDALQHALQRELGERFNESLIMDNQRLYATSSPLISRANSIKSVYSTIAPMSSASTKPKPFPRKTLVEFAQPSISDSLASMKSHVTAKTVEPTQSSRSDLPSFMKTYVTVKTQPVIPPDWKLPPLEEDNDVDKNNISFADSCSSFIPRRRR
uniref:Uncharacterized protein n=1 Tax=Panagrolaimus sp. PS1159 TaxID=55785 RepID=A0AC35F332_9BILA